MRNLYDAKRELDKECVADITQMVKKHGGRIEMEGDTCYLQVEGIMGEPYTIVVRALVMCGQFLEIEGSRYDDEYNEVQDETESYTIGEIVNLTELYWIHDQLLTQGY